jgi:hypothetical protein
MLNKFTIENKKQFISARGLNVLNDVFSISLPSELEIHETDGPCREVYGSPFYDGLLQIVRKEIEKTVGEKLYPTYSFARESYRGNILTPHVDRDGCIYSCSITLPGSDDTLWPFYCESDDGMLEILNEPGDMLIFKGCELMHYRNELQSDYKRSIFLHYVPHTPEFEKYRFDGRSSLSVEIEDFDDTHISTELQNFYTGAEQALNLIKQQQGGTQ